MERLTGPPYPQGDFKAANPKGALDFAVSAVLRDLVWVNAFLVFVSDRYLWHKQYLAGSSGLVFKQVLNSPIRFGMGDDTKFMGKQASCTKRQLPPHSMRLKRLACSIETRPSLLVGRMAGSSCRVWEYLLNCLSIQNCTYTIGSSEPMQNLHLRFYQ